MFAISLYHSLAVHHVVNFTPIVSSRHISININKRLKIGSMWLLLILKVTFNNQKKRYLFLRYYLLAFGKQVLLGNHCSHDNNLLFSEPKNFASRFS